MCVCHISSIFQNYDVCGMDGAIRFIQYLWREIHTFCTVKIEEIDTIF